MLQQAPETRVSPDAASITTADYLEQWLAHARGRVRAKTHDGYRGLVRLYARPGIGTIPLADLRPLDLQGLYGQCLERGLSGGTVLNLHLVLTQALSQAVRWSLITSNPAQGAQPPRPRRPERVVVDPALAARILVAVRSTHLELPVATAIATGMRRGEILALRWADLDAEHTVAHVRRSLQTSGGHLVFEEPKTRRSRRAVDLPAFLRPYLARQIEAQARRRSDAASWQDLDLVVDRGDGGPCNPDSMSSAWWGLCRKRGLPPVRFHDLRHAHATLMLLQGVHPKVVSERLGHASIGITLDTYSHVLPTMQAEAVLAFDQLFPTPGWEPGRLGRLGRTPPTPINLGRPLVPLSSARPAWPCGRSAPRTGG
jgi:integrase